jgi:hypothetical protein
MPGGVLYELASGELGAGGETSLALLLLFFHSIIVVSFLDRLARIACSDGERLQDQVRDRIRV